MKKLALFILLAVSSLSAIGQETRVSYILEGRRIDSSSSYIFDIGRQKGIVVVEISVDRSGILKGLQVGIEGTTTKNEQLLSAARSATTRTRFSSNRYAPAIQQGAIIYAFGEEVPTNLRTQLTEKYQGSSILKEEVDQDALKFLGIPIDGSIEYFTSQLIEKGFNDNYFEDYLEGQFNGEPVKVYVHTYRDKVDRVIVEFESSAEMSMQEQYNNLLSLLAENKKYNPIDPVTPIPADKNSKTDIKDYKTRFSDFDEGEVWLAIINRSGYHVCLYYDNLRNRPHGEDL